MAPVDNDLDLDQIDLLMEEKFRKTYSDRLGKDVYVLIEWLEKLIFKKHKKLFGYTDIGWTVKEPKKLIRELIKEGVWTIED